MTALKVVALLLAILTAHSSGHESMIRELRGERDLEEWLTGISAGLLTFYKPSCPWCRSYDLELEDAAYQLSAAPGVKLAQANLYQNRVLAARFRVTTTPSTIIFSGPSSSSHELYSGARTASGLVTAARLAVRRAWQAGVRSERSLSSVTTIDSLNFDPQVVLNRSQAWLVEVGPSHHLEHFSDN